MILDISRTRTKNTGRDGVPSRPEAERPQAERPRVPNPFGGGLGMGVGAGWGAFPGMEGGAPGVAGMAGGQVQFQAGLGFFPSLFGLQFVSHAPLYVCIFVIIYMTEHGDRVTSS